MKNLLCVASAIALCVTPALAGEGRVSDQSLSKMGLSGMKAMADSQGMRIRGLSVEVGGGSSASIHGVGGTAESHNWYSASGKNSASGNNASVAGDLTTTITTRGDDVSTKTTINVIGAGGFSSASSGGHR